MAKFKVTAGSIYRDDAVFNVGDTIELNEDAAVVLDSKIQRITTQKKNDKKPPIEDSQDQFGDIEKDQSDDTEKDQSAFKKLKDAAKTALG